MTETSEAITTLVTIAKDGPIDVCDTQDRIDAAVAALSQGTGAIAIDTERASGYRYSSRAYLIQFRREGAGTWLVDPTADVDLSALRKVVNSADWILHAATQDLGCLVEIDFVPPSLFDTEYAGRLLGRPKVGLTSLLESELGISLEKEHSAADWSTRPLPPEWLVYAALDVDYLLELREILEAELEARGRSEWARQEFEYLTAWRPPVQRSDPWRKTSGIHTVKNPLHLAVVRDLWHFRDHMARSRDKAPGRVLPDAAIIDIARKDLKSARDVFKLDSLRNRSHKALADQLWDIRQKSLAAKELPASNSQSFVLPPPKTWADKNPAAAHRWGHIRPQLNDLAAGLDLAPEMLISPETVRILCWDNPCDLNDSSAIDSWLRERGVRQWQREFICATIVNIDFDAAPPPIATTTELAAAATSQ